MHDLTADAIVAQGDHLAVNPYIFSSPAWLVFEAGRACAGMSTIKRAAMSRGYSVRLQTAGGSKVLVRFAGNNLDQITIDRA